MTDTENKNEIDKGKKRERVREEFKKHAFEQLLKSEGGRAWLWDELVACHVFATSFTGNSYTYFNEGERNRGLVLLDQVMNVDPDAFNLMIKENKDG